MDDLKKKVQSLSDDELENVSGGAWVPRGMDPTSVLVRCAVCEANGVEHYFWTRGYAANTATCKNTGKSFYMVDNIITINNYYDYQPYENMVSN